MLICFLLVLMAVQPVFAQIDFVTIAVTFEGIFISVFSVSVPTSPLSPLETAIVGFLTWVAIWMITYGFLSVLRIFRRQRWINVGLSFIMSVLTILVPVPIINKPIAKTIAMYILQFAGLWSVAVFGLMFIVGVWLYFKRRKADWSSQASVAAGYDEVVKGLRQELSSERAILIDLTQRLANTVTADKRGEIEKKITTVKDNVRSIENRLEELRSTMKSA